MNLARRRISKGKLILGLFGFLTIATASFLIARANFANAALAELNPDDWSLELILFDDDVNNGKDPLTSIDWTIEDSAPEDRPVKTITLQVNYRNSNVDRTYEPGELQIIVPNIYGTISANCRIGEEYSSYCLNSFDSRVAIGANYNGQSGYDWDLTSSSYTYVSNFYFVNSTPIEENSNTEGSIQITYSLVSEDYAVEFVDEHTTTSSFMESDGSPERARLNGNIFSNGVTMNYSRHVTHIWTKPNFTITKDALQLTSYDLLGENPEDYIWVKYNFSSASDELNEYGDPIIGLDEPSSTWTGNYIVGLKEFRIIDKFPSGLRILDMGGNEIPQDEEGYVDITEYGTYIDPNSVYYYPCSVYRYHCREIVVGYPKSIYNEDANTLNISNTVELYGTYSNSDIEEKLDDDTVDLYLEDFDFQYTPRDNAFYKDYCSKKYPPNYCSPRTKYYYQDMTSENGSVGAFMLTTYSYYNGTKYDLIIGDDLLYYSDEDGNSGILEDEKYYFSSIVRIGGSIDNANGATVDSSKYSMTLFVRRRGSIDYEEYGTYDYLQINENFTESDGIQAWYLVIHDVEESFMNLPIRTSVILKSENYARNGTIHNFSYIKQMSGDTLLNPTTIDSYNDVAHDIVAEYDISHHGSYIHRVTDAADWTYHQLGAVTHYLSTTKTSKDSLVEYNQANEVFNGYFEIDGSISDSVEGGAFSDIKYNAEQLSEDDWIKQINYYDLLPFGMEAGSEQSMASSAGEQYCAYDKYYGKDAKLLFSSKDECAAYTKEHTSISIKKNWNNTGRTRVSVTIDFSDKPFSTLTNPGRTAELPSINIYYAVPIDSYIEIGRTYSNSVYTTVNVDYTVSQVYAKVSDNGEKDPDAVDIDEDGITSEIMAYASANVSLLSATSSKQDIQTSVLTNHNGKYDTDPALSGYSEDYSYKLRVRTGPSRVTNLVVYEHLEEEYGANEHWQGNFNGVNIDYAETRTDNYGNPVKVKVYWSENSNAGSLKTDSSWQEYDENTTDKTRVRSIAFQYLDQEGNPAILPQSFYTYVIVDMKAPDGENILSLAYNNSHSEWNAIDNITGELIYNITGIDSNIVNVFLAEKFDLTAKKEWSDYDNAYNIRPDEITFNLYKGNELVDTKILDIANGDTQVIFNDLQTAEQNSYHIEELAVGEYTASYDRNAIQTITVTNTINRRDPNWEPGPFTGVNIKNTVIFISLIVVATVGGSIVILNRRS